MPLFVLSEQAGLCSRYVADILSGIKKEAEKKGIQLEDTASVGALGTDTALVVGYTENFFRLSCRRLLLDGITPIAVNLSDGEDFCAACIGFDRTGAAEKMLSYLLGCGRLRVAVAGFDDGSIAYREKLAAAKNYLNKQQKDFEFFEIYTGVTVASAAGRFLNSASQFDAVLCLDDCICAEITAGFKKRGICVPEDIFIASIGGSPVTEYLCGGVTAAEFDLERLGREAVGLHQYIKQSGAKSAVRQTVNFNLRVRRSTNNLPPKILNAEKSITPAAYRTDPDYIYFLRAQALIRGFDRIDRSIARGIVEGKTMSAIAEELFISNSSVKYRVKKMLKTASLSDRRELKKLIGYFGLL